MIIMIKILGIDDFSEIYNKRLVNDFPESEVKSLKKIIDMYKKDMYFVYGYYNENGELAGYAFFINDRTKDTVLLDYFAIVPEKEAAESVLNFLGKSKKKLQTVATGLFLRLKILSMQRMDRLRII